MDSDTLTVKLERVKEAAAKCPQAAETLKTLFPEAFEGEIDLRKLRTMADGGACPIFTPASAREATGMGRLIELRAGGDYNGKAFWLADAFTWEIRQDNERCAVLVPTRKA